MRRHVLLAMGALLASCPAPQAEPEVAPGDHPLPESFAPTGDEFLVAVVPDTQSYAMDFPETFETHIKWLADWADTYKIVFVTHVGDIVQSADADNEWEAARAAYQWLEDADVPHGFSVAAHDVWLPGDAGHDSSCSPFARTDCNAEDYLKNFGPERYADRPWFGGASPSGQSSFQLVDAGPFPLLFLHLPQDTPRAEVDWAHEVLDANPGTLAHLTTHRYLVDYRLTDALPSPLNLVQSGRFNALTYLLGGQSLTYHDGLEADELFEELIAAHPNIWGVHCGHVDAEFTQEAVNDAGLPVYEALVDYQSMADGGGGFLRLLKFQPSKNQIQALTFSTSTGEVRQNGDGFDHSIEILLYYRDAVTSELDRFGVDQEALDAFAAAVMNDPETRDSYYASLYADGQRDSQFTWSVDFQAYLDASR